MNKQTQNIETNETQNTTFEENGIIYEKITLHVPQKIVNFYRYLSSNTNLTPKAIMEKDLIEKLHADLEGQTAKEILGITKEIAASLNR